MTSSPDFDTEDMKAALGIYGGFVLTGLSLITGCFFPPAWAGIVPGFAAIRYGRIHEAEAKRIAMSR